MRPGRHLVVGMTHDRQPQRALARPVRPHQRVRLAVPDRQVDPAQDRLAVDGNVQAFDLERVSHVPVPARFKSNQIESNQKHYPVIF